MRFVFASQITSLKETGGQDDDFIKKQRVSDMDEKVSDMGDAGNCFRISVGSLRLTFRLFQANRHKHSHK